MDVAPLLPNCLKAVVSPTLPIEQMVMGMDVNEAVALVPRVFNLCRSAQTIALKASLGLPVPAPSSHVLAQEILRDHVVKIALKWPQHLGVQPIALPPDWQRYPSRLRQCLFGASGTMPKADEGFRRFLTEKTGVGAVLGAIQEAFSSEEATTSAMQITTPETIMQSGGQENSVAARQAHLPLMQSVEAEFGRGPLWRALAVALDIESCLDGILPPLATAPCGAIVVPAARGLYAVKAEQVEGKLCKLHRVTPTDHLLADDGVMAQSLSSLSCGAADPKAKLLVDILDPCIPVTLKEVSHA